MLKKIVYSFALLLICFTSFADDSGISIARGFSGVDGMNGYGLAIKNYWGNITNLGPSYELSGLWDTELMYWQTSDPKDNHYSNITVFSLTPIFRLQRRFAYNSGISPFIDIGYGLGLLNRNQFSDQKLGGYGTFLFTAGAGINFGQNSQYDLAYHYVNYNNAGQLRENDGLYANKITFTYHFGDS